MKLFRKSLKQFSGLKPLEKFFVIVGILTILGFIISIAPGLQLFLSWISQPSSINVPVSSEKQTGNPFLIKVTSPLHLSTVNSKSTVLQVETSENSVCEVYYYFDTGAISGFNQKEKMSLTGHLTHEHPITSLYNGLYDVYVECKGESGNSGQSYMKFYVEDKIPPLIFIIEPKNNSIITGDYTTIKVITNEPTQCLYNVFHEEYDTSTPTIGLDYEYKIEHSDSIYNRYSDSTEGLEVSCVDQFDNWNGTSLMFQVHKT